MHFSWSTIISVTHFAHFDLLYGLQAGEPEICDFAPNIKILTFKIIKINNKSKNQLIAKLIHRIKF